MESAYNESIVSYVNSDGSEYTIVTFGDSLNVNQLKTAVESTYCDNVQLQLCEATSKNVTPSTMQELQPLSDSRSSSEKQMSGYQLIEPSFQLLKSKCSPIGLSRRGRPPKTSTPIANYSFNGSFADNVSISNYRLNSSGEETTSSDASTPSSVFLKVPNNTPAVGWVNISSPLDCTNSSPSISGRQNMKLPKVGHNESERKRRSRIKNACAQLRLLVPSLTEKSDKATVLECTVQFLLDLKQTNAQLFQIQ